MSVRATTAHLAWLASSLPAYRRFAAALENPAAAQARWLEAHLRRNGDSAFGRAHGCSAVGNPREFARHVPVRTFEELAPWIDRVRRGEENVLTTESVKRLMPTSGSSAAHKLIPYTAALQREFNAAIGPWLVDLCRAHPSIAGGSAYWSVTPLADPAFDESTILPIGFEDDSEYLGGIRARLVAAVMAVPSSTRHIRELGEFRRTVLLHLLRRADLRFISVWHPSFLELLLDALARDWDALLAALAAGPDRRRARELSNADPARPKTIWPRLGQVSCWADAHARGPAAELQRRLPGIAIQPKGLLATEAFVTVPFRGHYPLAICSHFFEFIDADGDLHPVEALRVGQKYEVVVTTGGGLWRYRLGDMVEVTGVLARTPTLRFIGRAGIVSDYRGEKLSDAFVTQVLARVCGGAAFALLAPDAADGTPRYTLWLEPGGGRLVSATELDDALQANPHYALCRRLGQLGPAGIALLSTGAYSRYAAAETARGLRLGDIKPVALSTRTDWAMQFEAGSIGGRNG